MSKKYIYLLALVTLLVFPLPTFYVLQKFDGINFWEILDLKSFKLIPILYGLEFGIIYAFAASIILKAPVFENMPHKVEKVVQSMNLTFLDAIFLSLCAGIGEELLFRSGVQHYLGIWPTSIIFVAIHGYFSIRNPKNSLYGIIVLPFILLISYGFNHFGLWFSVAAHFAYDAILFIHILSDKKTANVE